MQPTVKITSKLEDVAWVYHLFLFFFFLFLLLGCKRIFLTRQKSDNSSTLATAIVGGNSNRASVTPLWRMIIALLWLDITEKAWKHSAKAISINNFSSERVDSKGLYRRWRLQVIGSRLNQLPQRSERTMTCIAQNAYCSRDIYFQFNKVCRSVISCVVMRGRYESASTIGCLERTRNFINNIM